MGKTLKYVLWAIGALVLIVVVVVAYVAATFDPEKYKPEIVKLVKDKTGRTLTIDGKIGLTFFPKIGAEVDRLTLSEPNSSKVFARIGEAQVAVALIPLLSKQVIVDRVTLSDLSVDLVRGKDGRTNIDDLTGGQPAQKPGEPAKAQASEASGKAPVLDIGGIALRNANIGWRDERDGTDIRVSKLDLTTGRIASGVPGELSLSGRVDGTQPKLALDAAVDTGYQIDFDTQAVSLKGLDAKVKGDAPGFAGLDAGVKGDLAIDPKGERVDLSGFQVTAKSKEGLEARFSIPQLALAPGQAKSQAIEGVLKFARGEQAIDAKIALSAAEAKGKQVEFSSFAADVNLKQGDLALQGKITTPVSLNLAASEARLAKIAGDIAVSSPDLPAKTIKIALAGSAGANWAKQTAQADLVTKVDDSTIQTKASVANFAAPAINFDIAADRLNVDRYLPSRKAGAAGGGASKPSGGGGAPGGKGDDAKIDLSALTTLNANGSLRIGALTVSNIKAQDVQVKLRAAGGQVNVDPIAANLYKGTVAGNANINAKSNAFAVKQQLKGIEIGPLLRDAAGKDLLEGRGSVNLDVTTAGMTVSALKKGLNGTSSFNLRDGAIKGVDVAGTLQKAKALLGSQKTLDQPAQGGAKTDFTELSGSFVIKNGIAHNQDLQGKSPLLRLAGAGDINIGTDSIDYMLKPTIVATSTGQGGKDLSDVHGLTAPVHITGTFDNLKYRVDVGALAADVAKSAVTREIERRLGGGQQGGDGQPGSGGSLGDALRGLLKR
ncbi:MAG: AsmA family protein [Betaproteobacteria bacterium]|nr:AsmA family protein [Betaproteobacteria bacterium]